MVRHTHLMRNGLCEGGRGQGDDLAGCSVVKAWGERVRTHLSVNIMAVYQ
jgi:hypothetical protein